MSDEHKAALARGREDGAKVRRYLEALAAQNQPGKRGRRRTPESIQERLIAIGKELRDADPLKKVQLISEQIGLEQDLEQLTAEPEPVDLSEPEKGFVEAAKAYSESKGIVYGAWRAVGVPPKVLLEVGIPHASRNTRSSRPNGYLR